MADLTFRLVGLDENKNSKIFYYSTTSFYRAYKKAKLLFIHIHEIRQVRGEII